MIDSKVYTIKVVVVSRSDELPTDSELESGLVEALPDEWWDDGIEEDGYFLSWLEVVQS